MERGKGGMGVRYVGGDWREVRGGRERFD